MSVACDDGNLINGDGCSSTCTIEAGWDCGYGDYYTADICWPLDRPDIIDSAISSNNDIILITLNATVLTSRKHLFHDIISFLFNV
jgi:hypothetical protein